MFGDLLQTSFAENVDPKKGIVTIIDEASTATEQSVWAAIVKLITKERIVQRFGGVNPIKAIMLAGYSRQAWPLNKWKKFVEFPFEYPLFCRLIDGGFMLMSSTSKFVCNTELAAAPANSSTMER